MDPEKTQIEQERFDAIRTLSEIQLEISNARIAFQKLKETEEEYIKFREDKVSSRLDSLTESLSGAFKSFLENKEIFEKLAGMMKAMTETAVNTTAEIKESQELITARLETVDEMVRAKVEKINEDARKIKLDRAELNTKMEDFANRMRALLDAEKKLAEERRDFEQRWKTTE